MGKKAKAKTSRALDKLPPLTSPTDIACDQEKLRANLSAYMEVSGRLRAKRSEVFEAGRRGTLADREALKMAIEVEKLKRASDKLRLSVCEQLRALIEQIHRYLDTAVDSTSRTKANGREPCCKPSPELAAKYTELLHTITITAVKEEISEKQRLLSNVRLHNGRSAVYVMLRSRWRVRPRSW